MTGEHAINPDMIHIKIEVIGIVFHRLFQVIHTKRQGINKTIWYFAKNPKPKVAPKMTEFFQFGLSRYFKEKKRPRDQNVINGRSGVWISEPRPSKGEKGIV